MSTTANFRKRAGFTLIELLVVIAIIAVLASLILPGYRGGTREPARRSICKNNFKQIGLALHNYHDEHGAFPPAYTVDADGNRLHSWRTLILPYMDEQELYDKIDLSKPWDDPANAFAYEMNFPFYRCPSAEIPENHTTYVAIAGEDCAFQGSSPRKMEAFTDGLTYTGMVAEVDSQHSVHWMSPHDTDGDYLADPKNLEELPHNNAGHVLFGDGAVHYVSQETPPEQLRGLTTIAGDDAMLE